MRYCLVFIRLILNFISITLHQHIKTNNNIIFFVIDVVTGEFTLLIIQKYGFDFCVILFGFYSTRFKVYIHSPCINTQQQTTKPFNYTLNFGPKVSYIPHRVSLMKIYHDYYNGFWWIDCKFRTNEESEKIIRPHAWNCMEYIMNQWYFHQCFESWTVKLNIHYVVL